jgi:hypothetical protein
VAIKRALGTARSDYEEQDEGEEQPASVVLPERPSFSGRGSVDGALPQRPAASSLAGP